jgi:RNA polymerase primary sigma factor
MKENETIKISKKDITMHEEELRDYEEEKVFGYINEILNYAKDPNLSLYIREIESIRIPTKEENKQLATKALEGDLKARDMLINLNLALVIWTIKKMKTRLPEINHFKMLDLIQEGNIGLMKAVDNYNPEKGSFSTYAKIIIEASIKNALFKSELEIHRPKQIITKATQYLEYINSFIKEGKPIPSDLQIRTYLGITKETLENIRKHLQIDMTYIDAPMTEENDKSIVDNIKDNSIPSINTNLNNTEFCLLIKNALNVDPVEYFVIYHIYLKESPSSQVEIAKMLGVEHQRIDQIAKRVLKKLKRINFQDNKLLEIVIENIKRREGSNFYRLRISPLNIKDLIIYSYIKKYLTDEERSVLDLKIFGDYTYTPEELAKSLKISLTQLRELEYSIDLKAKNALSDYNNYLLYETIILKKYKSSILNIKNVDELVLENERKLKLSVG